MSTEPVARTVRLADGEEVEIRPVTPETETLFCFNGHLERLLYLDVKPYERAWNAYSARKLVGSCLLFINPTWAELELNPAHGHTTVEAIYVVPELRRKGLASRFTDLAREYGQPLYGYPITTEGLGFAKAKMDRVVPSSGLTGHTR